MDWHKFWRQRKPHSSAVIPSSPVARVPGVSQSPAQGTRDDLLGQVAHLSSLLAAWRKVKANHGSAGIDGVTIEEFEKNLRANLEEIAKDLQRGAFRPQPVKRVYVPKPSGGVRPLAILGVKDRIVQRALYDAIAPRFEREFLDCSFGFREGRSTQDAATRVSGLRQRGLRWVVDGDIKNCFENLDHRLLLRAVQAEIRDARVLQLIEQWLKAQIFNEMNRRDLSVGTFQGGVLSPLLANIYLHRFDVQLTHAHQNLVRYADDWLILCRTQREAESALETAKRALEALRLAINPYKTHIVTFEQGFKFVGRFFVRDEVFDLSANDRRPLTLGR